MTFLSEDIEDSESKDDGYNCGGSTTQFSAMCILDTRGSSWHTIPLPVEDSDDSYFKPQQNITNSNNHQTIHKIWQAIMINVNNLSLFQFCDLDLV